MPGGTLRLRRSGGNNGTLVGDTSWTNDPNRDWCLNFDGSGDYVSIGNESFFDISGPITITTWIKVNSPFDSMEPVIVSKGDMSWKLYMPYDAGEVTFSCAGLDYDVTTTSDIDDGRWYHIAAVYDGSQLCLYVDGILDVNQNVSGNCPKPI